MHSRDPDPSDRTLRNHFSTIGVNGLNEAIRNFTGDRDDITTPGGHALALRLLDHVRTRMIEFQETTGHLYNLEATPAEGTTYRFAREDRKRYPGIRQAGSAQAPYYTNSSQLPVGFTDDPFEALQRQDQLQGRYTGGTVLHLYLPEQVSAPVTRMSADCSQTRSPQAGPARNASAFSQSQGPYESGDGPVERVVQHDTDENHHADVVIFQESIETTGRLAIARQPQVPGHHAGGEGDGKVVPGAKLGTVANEDESDEDNEL